MSQSLAEYVPVELRVEMARRKISNSELARRLGTDDTWVGRRLNGATAITLGDLDRMAAAIGCPVTTVLRSYAPEVAA